MTAKKPDPEESSGIVSGPEIDTGYFHIFQNSKIVGEVVVETIPGNPLPRETWITYGAAGTIHGTTAAAYVRPSATNTNVTTKFSWQSSGAKVKDIWQGAKDANLSPTSEQAFVDKNTTGPNS